MVFLKQWNRIQKLHDLIQQEYKGTPQKYAERLGICRSHMYRLLEILKEQGATIKYSRKSGCFFYLEEFSLNSPDILGQVEFHLMHRNKSQSN